MPFSYIQICTEKISLSYNLWGGDNDQQKLYKNRKNVLKKNPKIDPFNFCLNLPNFYIILQQKHTYCIIFRQIFIFFSFHHFIGQKHTKLGDRKSPFFAPFWAQKSSMYIAENVNTVRHIHGEAIKQNGLLKSCLVAEI